MLPYLQLFGHQVPLYGICVMLGIALAVLYLLKSTPGKWSLPVEVEQGLLYGLIGTFLGAKLFWLLQNLPSLLADLPFLFSQTESFLQAYIYSGFVAYGGLLGAGIAVLLYCRITHTAVMPLLHTMLPIIPLIHGCGRIGCFCMGCCYGCEATGAWPAMVFHSSPIAPNGIPLIPVQIMEAAALLLLFALLAWMRRKGTHILLMLSAYTGIYGAVRFLLEFLRGDLYRGFWGALSVSQVFSLLFLAAAAVFLWLGMRRKKPLSQK